MGEKILPEDQEKEADAAGDSSHAEQAHARQGRTRALGADMDLSVTANLDGDPEALVARGQRDSGRLKTWEEAFLSLFFAATTGFVVGAALAILILSGDINMGKADLEKVVATIQSIAALF